MRNCDEHIGRAINLEILGDDLQLIANAYGMGGVDGEVAYRSCMPPCILKSNLVLHFLINGLPKHWDKNESGYYNQVINLMTEAYYDGFNSMVKKRDVLSSDFFN
jgi:hypothetical protein